MIVPVYSNMDSGFGRGQEACVFKDATIAFRLKISTRVASYNPWEEKKRKTIFCTFRVEALTKITSESPNPHSSNGTTQAYTPEWPRHVPITPGNSFPGSCWLRAVRNTTRAAGREPASGGHAPKRTRRLHVFSSEGRRQKNAGNEAAMLGHVAWSGNQEAEDWSFWFPLHEEKRLAAGIGLGKMLFG